MGIERLSTGLQELTERECVRLLESQEYGRIGVVVDGRPEIFPLNYALDESRCVVFRTVVGMKLASAVNHHVVFEVDRVDPVTRSGWSVVVHGVAHQTGRINQGLRPLAPWLPDRSPWSGSHPLDHRPGARQPPSGADAALTVRRGR